MDAQSSSHPTPETLEAYGLGQSDDELAAVIARHLEACPECRRRVADAVPDTFLDRLRDAQAGPAIPGSGAGGPTFDPAATGASPAVSDDTRTAVDDSPDGAGLQPGTRIGYFGDYELERVLGEGGMGIVYKARQLSLNRPVALKMIRAARFPSADEVRRFQNEAEAVARLDHPNIVPIFEVGRYEDQHYFSMKLIAGESLDKRLKEYFAEPRRAARLVAVTADAIHHAHQRGILHRDLKPANILVDPDGQPHVTDFGLAKRVEGDSELTRSGAIIGTPAYMAPEQASAKKGAVTTTTDIYGLGAILYALLTGRAPFGGTTVVDTLEQVRVRIPERPRKLNARVPRDLEVVCLKCLEKDPRRRYASADALTKDLQCLLAGEPIAARPVGTGTRVWMWCQRRPLVAGLMGAVLVAVLGGLIGTSLGLLAALRAWAEETKQTQLAMQRLQDTRKAQTEARAQAEFAAQRLYDAQMNWAQRYWDEYDGELLQQVLAEQLPTNQHGIDRRGFEWFYWQRKMSSGHITLTGHPDVVWCVAFSSDGRRLASTSADGTVKVWDTESGKKSLTFKGYRIFGYASVNSMTFSPDGKRLAAASATGPLKVWNAGTMQMALIFRGHTGAALRVVFSPDGRRLASASADGTVKVWDAATGKETFTLGGRTGPVRGVAFSPDGRRLASAGEDGAVKVWDTELRNEPLTLRGHTGAVWNVAFSPDGRRLASCGTDGMVKMWNTEIGTETLAIRGHIRGVTDVVFSPDGRRLASVSAGAMLIIWDTGTGQKTLALGGHTGHIKGLTFSPDGRRLASCGTDKTVRVWNTESDQESLALRGGGHTGRVLSVTFSPDGRRLASSAGGMVTVWDAASGKETLTLRGHTDAVWGVAFSPDGRRLAASDNDQAVKIWDADSGRETRTLDGYASVAFSPDGRRLASVGPHMKLRILDVETGQETLTLRGDFDRGTRVSFSPDGRRLAACSGDGVYSFLGVWDARTGQQALTFGGNSGAPLCVAFSPDGRRLAAANTSYDRTVRLWDAATGKEVLTFKGHTDVVRGVSFSPDGRRLASCGADGMVKIWNTQTGQETLTLKGYGSVAFSPDGKWLVSSDLDGTLKLWDGRPLGK